MQPKSSQFYSPIQSIFDRSDRMALLETPKLIFTLQCVYPATKSTSKWKKIEYISFALAIFSGNFLGMITHLGYALKFNTIDFEGSIFASTGVVAFSGVTYVIITVFVLRKQISAILDNLLLIYDMRE